MRKKAVIFIFGNDCFVHTLQKTCIDVKSGQKIIGKWLRGIEHRHNKSKNGRESPSINRIKTKLILFGKLTKLKSCPENRKTLDKNYQLET